eukprot:TRINITY_DN105017_c0_g1_i1.p1 TRINITY_DN105017_c0_g1~~TRINITY_DN105017_c0_g1_i1.p1  ORF type:complete len:772 (-),score=39.22 TRINITY_DN105017_c0_g1_i1:63-2378(-)
MVHAITQSIFFAALENRILILSVTYLYVSSFWRVFWGLDAAIEWTCLAYYFVRSYPFADEKVGLGVILLGLGIHCTFCLNYSVQYNHKTYTKYLTHNKGKYLWQALSGVSADGIIIFNPEKIHYINTTALETFHKRTTDLLGKPFAALASELKKLEFEDKKEGKCLQNPGLYHKDLYELVNHYMTSMRYLGPHRIYMGNGERVFSVFCNRFILEKEKHYLLSIRDITQMKDVECFRTKSILLSSLSHELKTPLNAVIDTLKWFSRSMANITKKGLKIAYTSSQLLHNYVSNVLDYTDYTNGWNLTNKPVNTNVRKVVRKVNQLYENQVQVCKAVLNFLVESNVPAYLRMDRKRLLQILTNVLGISLRYTYRGCVFLRVSYAASTLRITVDDTGTGLPFSVRPGKLFNMLRDVDPTFCDSGIHLAATQVIVNALDGSMNIWTGAQQGTRISITIPTNVAEDFCRTRIGRYWEQERPRSKSASGIDRRLLTEPEQKEVEEVINGVEACNFDASKMEEFPHKPTVRGWVKPRIFPMIKSSTAATPLATSPHNFLLELREEFPGPAYKKEEGGIENSPKQELRKLIPNNPECACSKILVVDDNALNLFVAEEIIKRLGLKCDKASNGYEAVQMAIRSGKCPICHGYDIILMDCNMPIMNGFEAAYRLKELMDEKVIKKAPIIGNSAFNEGDCLPKCNEAGMTAFCTFLCVKTKNSAKTVDDKVCRKHSKAIWSYLKEYWIYSVTADADAFTVSLCKQCIQLINNYHSVLSFLNNI